MKGNIGHGCLNGISSVWHPGTAPYSLINKGMFNQAQVERKGLQMGLPSELGLVPARPGRVIVFCSGRWVCGVFPLPCDRSGQKEQQTFLSCPVNDGRLMRRAEVTTSEQKHNVQLFVEHLPSNTGHTHKLTNSFPAFLECI